ncbi:hypothetical protein [Streptomyces deccanensis]|uniref:hypothetical protein n=1 Tax=Streptomyces deccanensis TaxID=424188 RepID=UPI001EFBDCF5|nr:hypothetical protein [Streptomyces deccanensis]ULR51516.1 hypothetical protein L3078_20640 [Streptomyces deccanensis]
MTAQVMIRWKLGPDALERHEGMLRTVYEELDSVRPQGLRYDTYQLDDKVTFVSFVEMADGPGVLGGLNAFQSYRAALDALCVEPPEVIVLHSAGEYVSPS